MLAMLAMLALLALLALYGTCTCTCCVKPLVLTQKQLTLLLNLWCTFCMVLEFSQHDKLVCNKPTVKYSHVPVICKNLTWKSLFAYLKSMTEILKILRVLCLHTLSAANFYALFQLLHALFCADVDPCQKIVCSYDGMCQVFGPDDARCVCHRHQFLLLCSTADGLPSSTVELTRTL